MVGIDASGTGRPMRSARAFTLIELLVVIAIIAILAAVLFPVFAQARKRASATACLDYTSQFAKAAYLYTGDYNDKFPCYINFVQGGQWIIRLWWDTLQPYVKSTEVYRCPTAGAPDESNGAGDTNPYGRSIWGSVKHQWQFAGYRGSHTTNGWMYGPGTSTGHTNGVSLTIVREPTHTMLFSDGVWVDAWPEHTGTLDPSRDNVGRIFIDRHGGGVNVAFTDGHAKQIHRDALLRLDDGRPVIYKPHPSATP